MSCETKEKIETVTKLVCPYCAKPLSVWTAFGEYHFKCDVCNYTQTELDQKIKTVTDK